MFIGGYTVGQHIESETIGVLDLPQTGLLFIIAVYSYYKVKMDLRVI